MLMRTLLVRGMLAGLAAGVLALVFAWIFGEPQVGHAIAFEDQQARLAGAAPAPELVSRHRAGDLRPGGRRRPGRPGARRPVLHRVRALLRPDRAVPPRATAALVAAGGFAAVELVPFLKYPANPPSVGSPATIGHRTVLYFTMIAISVAASIAAVQIGRRLAPRFGNWNASLLAVRHLYRPRDDRLPGAARRQRSARGTSPRWCCGGFRLASLGTQAVLWAALGLVFGALTERSLARAEQRTGQVPVTRA
jgi:predicted cobalt transporter CbtA